MRHGAQPVKDRQTVTADGQSLQRLPDGASFREVPLHVDDRGQVCEMFDPRWGWHDDPLVFAYFCTIRPGVTKGWSLHRQHEDRYFLVSGEMELVFYDPRPESTTFGEVIQVYLSEQRRRLINVPVGVWHADRNIGSSDCVVVNFPTIPYDHADPDKYRLPLDTDQIPHTFQDARGG